MESEEISSQSFDTQSERVSDRSQGRKVKLAKQSDTDSNFSSESIGHQSIFVSNRKKPDGHEL